MWDPGNRTWKGSAVKVAKISSALETRSGAASKKARGVQEMNDYELISWLGCNPTMTGILILSSKRRPWSMIAEADRLHHHGLLKKWAGSGSTRPEYEITSHGKRVLMSLRKVG